MWRIKLFFNWIYVCWRFRSLAPWSARFIDFSTPTPEDIKWAREVSKKIVLDKMSEDMRN